MSEQTIKAREWLRENWRGCEVYGYGEPFKGAQYKTLWFLPRGVLMTDTGGASIVTREWAREMIRGYASARYPIVRIRPEDARGALGGIE